MSKGVLFVAFNSTLDNGSTLQYTELAKIAANRVRQHLKLPVGIVTDAPIDGFDETVLVDRPTGNNRQTLIGSYSWHNDYRRQLYDLTPWSQTLLLDVDYILQTDQFLTAFEFNGDFQIAGKVYDPTGRNSFQKYLRLPNRTIPQMWATAMYWNRAAKPYFDYANMIADNYEYYAKVFNFSSAQFRNDMIFSIVAHMLPVHQFPQHMWMVSSDCNLIDANHSGLKFEYNNSVVRVNNDVHILDKSILTDSVKLDLLQKWSRHND
jgi:hypothetical protein